MPWIEFNFAFVYYEFKDIAVAGLIRTGGELANGKQAPGCRAFFPGNVDSLAEQSNAGWELLIEFVSDVSDVCV